MSLYSARVGIGAIPTTIQSHAPAGASTASSTTAAATAPAAATGWEPRSPLSRSSPLSSLLLRVHPYQPQLVLPTSSSLSSSKTQPTRQSSSSSVKNYHVSKRRRDRDRQPTKSSEYTMLSSLGTTIRMQPLDAEALQYPHRQQPQQQYDGSDSSAIRDEPDHGVDGDGGNVMMAEDRNPDPVIEQQSYLTTVKEETEPLLANGDLDSTTIQGTQSNGQRQHKEMENIASRDHLLDCNDEKKDEEIAAPVVASAAHMGNQTNPNDAVADPIEKPTLSSPLEEEDKTTAKPITTTSSVTATIALATPSIQLNISPEQNRPILDQLANDNVSSPPQVAVGGAVQSPFLLSSIWDRLMSDTAVRKWIDLPTICVVGDTSSGKSSVLSQLCQVELPAAHSITTRCPIRVTIQPLSSSDQQSQQGQGQRRAVIDVEWNHNTRSTSFSTPFRPRVVSDQEWDDIPAIIEDTQRWILHHHHMSLRQSKQGSTKSDNVTMAADVAPHLVVVTVQVQAGPLQHPAHAWTVVDLPGLVQTAAAHESSTLAADIRALVTDYVRRPNNVFLAVLPAHVDFHNSHVLATMQQIDPSSLERTIPVLTKPDLIDSGAEDDVVQLLLGHKIVCGPLGFHMVKGRGQAALDRKQSLQDAVDDEERFFSQVDPWKSQLNRSLFGTVCLRHKVAALQLQLIRKHIPRILFEIRQRQQSVLTALSDMGDVRRTDAERRRYYQDICQLLVSQLKASLSGKGRRSTKLIKKTTAGAVTMKGSSHRSPSAAAALHEACTDFVHEIKHGSLETIKTVVEGAQVIVTSARGCVAGEVVHLDHDFACVDYIKPIDRSSEVLFDYVGQISNRDSPVEENVVWSDGSKIYIGRKNNIFDTLRKIPLLDIRTDPAWLKEKIAENRTDELPCFLNVDTFKNIVSEFIEDDWKPPCTKLLERTRQIMLSAVQDAVHIAVPADRYLSLPLWAEQQCRQAAMDLFNDASNQVHAQLEMEKHPYTQDSALLDKIAELRHRSLRRELELSLRLDQEGVFDTQAIRTIMDGVFDRVQHRPVDDHMAEEMELILSSYGHVATRRMMDRIPMVCWSAFRTLELSIQDRLWSVTDEMLIGCMHESPDFVHNYQAMEHELHNLNKTLRMMESIS